MHSLAAETGEDFAGVGVREILGAEAVADADRRRSAN
jgi:hypothetical protein